MGGLELPEGDFWIDWQSKLTADGAHFAPPIAIPGLRSNPRYNARQRLTTFDWQDVIDLGVPAASPDSALDFPFIIYGSGPPSAVGSGPSGIPDAFVLHQNYPNPFNPSTKIRFVIPNGVRNLKDFSSQAPRNDNSLVTLKIYDVLGNEIATLVNEEKTPGTYEVEFNSHSGPASPAGRLSGIRTLTSGMYFYTLKAGSYSETKKMILLK